MGLFSTKKEKKSSVSKMDSLPPLPDFPEDHEFSTELPVYEPTINDIKTGVQKDTFEIPKRVTKPTKKLVDVPREVMSTRDEDKPLFIKIENYKIALKSLDTLKIKIGEAEKLLEDVDRIRADEEVKLTSWKEEVAKLKEKLISIDHHLFEV